jgi:hypothetical protein
LCSSTVDANNICVVVEGQLTLYSDPGNSAQSEKQSILSSIKASMDSGRFVGVQENIARVTYVNLLPDIDSGSTGATSGVPSDAAVNSESSMVRVGLFLGAGILTAVVVGVAYSRRKKSASDDAETNEFGDQSEVV